MVFLSKDFARGWVAALVLALFASCAADRAPVAPPDPPPPAPPESLVVPSSIPVRIGAALVQAELAATSAQRSTGLMGRTSLPDTAGMLFLFTRDQVLDFWMKDTPIDLSIAFIDADRRIINIEPMTANDLSSITSAGPARYALEVRRGWFADRGISAGALVEFTLPVGLRIDP
jgi:uncharacterized membrane protein (UPF0127 family)